ncbi:MAG: hypothetical protein BRC44_12675 [Cyanobacteria bacterium QS_4_48_99]|nr:MAG: hypothetical protein BRC44_12675 [Cyanobacteria bacterium QS_4_48_99]
MATRKKKFRCGHRGYGQICHRCEQEQQDRSTKKQQKQDWKETFAHDPIDMTALPKNVVIKTRRIINDLEHQKSYHEFRGKRLRHNRWIISIPVTRHYRLICRDCGSFLAPEAVVSHQDYNVSKPGS